MHSVTLHAACVALRVYNALQPTFYAAAHRHKLFCRDRKLGFELKVFGSAVNYAAFRTAACFPASATPKMGKSRRHTRAVKGSIFKRKLCVPGPLVFYRVSHCESRAFSQNHAKCNSPISLTCLVMITDLYQGT
eukprot:1698479-Rhodomonas_salina.6